MNKIINHILHLEKNKILYYYDINNIVNTINMDYVSRNYNENITFLTTQKYSLNNSFWRFIGQHIEKFDKKILIHYMDDLSKTILTHQYYSKNLKSNLLSVDNISNFLANNFTDKNHDIINKIILKFGTSSKYFHSAFVFVETILENKQINQNFKKDIALLFANQKWTKSQQNKIIKQYGDFLTKEQHNDIIELISFLVKDNSLKFGGTNQNIILNFIKTKISLNDTDFYNIRPISKNGSGYIHFTFEKNISEIAIIKDFYLNDFNKNLTPEYLEKLWIKSKLNIDLKNIKCSDEIKKNKI